MNDKAHMFGVPRYRRDHTPGDVPRIVAHLVLT